MGSSGRVDGGKILLNVSSKGLVSSVKGPLQMISHDGSLVEFLENVVSSPRGLRRWC